MIKRLTIISSLASLLAGCLSIDGTYYPGCAAYEGSKVVLGDGNFVWDRYTDQVIVGADGNAVDQFPDYPKRGSYEVDGRVLRMHFTDDQSVETMQVHQHDGRLLLLTSAEVDEWERTGGYRDCTLTREARAAN